MQGIPGFSIGARLLDVQSLAANLDGAVEGAGDLIEIPSTAEPNPRTGPVREAWIYRIGLELDDLSILGKAGFYSERQRILTVGNTGKFSAHLGVPAFYYFDGATTSQLTTRYHVPLTFDGSRLPLYANGTREGSASLTGNIIATFRPLRIGGLNRGSWP